jgi:hypothetical protein
MSGALYHDSGGGALVAAFALVLGILATICPFLFFVSANFIVFAIPIALVGLLLGILARRGAIRRSQPTGLATFAVVLGVVPLMLSAGMLVMYARAIKSAKEFAPHDPAQAEKLKSDHIKNSKEFDEMFKKALQKDEPPKEKVK